MREQRFGALSSSTNGQELSLTVVSTVRLVLMGLVAAGVITATGADTTLEQIPVLVTAGLATWETVQVLWGAVRKVFYAIYPAQ